MDYDQLTFILEEKNGDRTRWVLDVTEWAEECVDAVWDIIADYVDMSYDASPTREIEYVFLDNEKGEIIKSKKKI